MLKITVNLEVDFGTWPLSHQTLQAAIGSDYVICGGCDSPTAYSFRNLSDWKAPNTSLCLSCLATADDVTKIVIQ